jgi:hypothetical protein
MTDEGERHPTAGVTLPSIDHPMVVIKVASLPAGSASALTRYARHCAGRHPAFLKGPAGPGRVDQETGLVVLPLL